MTRKSLLQDINHRKKIDKVGEKIELNKDNLSEFDSIFQGYIMGNSIANGGSIMNTTVLVPSIISRLNRRNNVAIEKVIQKEEKVNKATNRVVEKYADMEQHVRMEICKRKLRIYNQQKHYTKKSMYEEEIYGFSPPGFAFQ
jgi:hypothetical protein